MAPSAGMCAAPGDVRPGPACAPLGEPAAGPAGAAVPRGARTAPAGALPAAGCWAYGGHLTCLSQCYLALLTQRQMCHGAAQRAPAPMQAAEAKPVFGAGEQNGLPGGAVPRGAAGVAAAAQPASGVPGASDGGARAVGGAPGAAAEASLGLPYPTRDDTECGAASCFRLCQ